MIFYTKVSYIKHRFYASLWHDRMILFIYVVVMPSSFLVACFVNDCSIFANHNLCLYGMCFLLSRIVRFATSIIYWPWNLLFCGIYKSKKARKVLFNFFRCL